MKITVMGASGLIGTKVAQWLTSRGHDVVAASRGSGADVLTGKGLAEALAGSQVLVDVTNSPSFEDAAVMAFFTASASNLVAAAKAAGVGHYVALSIVGVDDLPASGYMRAKVAQEKTIAASGLPYTIVRATQFAEFAEAITRSLDTGSEVRAPDALIQPIAAADVAAEVAHVASAAPLNRTTDIGGPEKISFADMARALLANERNDKPVIVDPAATYFGTPLETTSLVTREGASLGTIRFADWLRRAAREDAVKKALTVVQCVRPPFIPGNAEAMTAVVEWPPGSSGAPPHRHPGGPAFGYVLEGEMLFELEGEAPRVIKAGEAFWEPGGDVIHYSDANNRADVPLRFVVTMLCVPGQPMLVFVEDEELERRKERRGRRG